MSTLSTHVLDAVRGGPAAGVPVRLTGPLAAPGRQVDEAGVTSGDGRWRAAAELPPGTYRLVFDTGAWFAATGTDGFYPEVAVTFTVRAGHHHVPLLLSPFAYSTYRGS